MEEVRQLITWLLWILPVATTVNVVYCIIAMNIDQDMVQSYKKRIRNAVAFLIIAETAMGLVNVIAGYYS